MPKAKSRHANREYFVLNFFTPVSHLTKGESGTGQVVAGHGVTEFGCSGRRFHFRQLPRFICLIYRVLNLLKLRSQHFIPN